MTSHTKRCRAHLAGAGLDIFDAEPLDPNRVEGVPNLIATPLAYYSEKALQESQLKAATQVVRFLTLRSPTTA